MIGDLLPTLARAQGESIAQIQRSIQSGVIPAYIGIPLLQQKLQQRQEAQSLLMGRQQQGQPPIAQQVMQQADQITQPQQMAQAPQGIESAPSNLPEKYAGGGIVAFADNEDQPVSVDMPRTRQYDDSYVPTDRMGYQKTGFLDWLLPPYERPEGMSEEEYNRIRRGATTPPKAGPLTPPAQAAPGSPRENAPAPGTGSVSPPVVADKKPAEEEKKPPPLTVERGPTKRPEPAPSQIFGPPPKDAIADLLAERKTSQEELKNLILGDAKDRKKQLDIQTLLKVMQGGFKAAGGTSPYAMANIGPAAAETAGGIGELYAQQEADKQKRVGQLVALGLKGQELGAELAKLGITKDYYDKHAKLFEAQADYYRRRPATAGGVGTGSISSAVTQSELDRIEGYRANPKTAPFFSMLPPDVQTGLTKYPPSSASYQRSLELFDKYANEYLRRRLGTIHSYGIKQSPTAVAGIE